MLYVALIIMLPLGYLAYRIADPLSDAAYARTGNMLVYILAFTLPYLFCGMPLRLVSHGNPSIMKLAMLSFAAGSIAAKLELGRRRLL